MYRLLDEEFVTAFDFYKIMKMLEADIKKKHNDEQICKVICMFEGMIKYLTKLVNFCHENKKKEQPSVKQSDEKSG